MSAECYIAKSAQVKRADLIGKFSTVGENCKIGNNTKIGYGVLISDNVTIGDNCYIGDMVTICANVIIGDNTYIDGGVAIVDRLIQRSHSEREVCKTIIGKHVIIHAKAVIEAGNYIIDNARVAYGDIVPRKN